MTNEFSCDAYATFLVDIVKSGNSYSISDDVKSALSGTPELASGTYVGTDGHYILSGSKTVLDANVTINADTITGYK
ncbi:MAG: hypothetical protein R2771_08450 [Saprospiraceae bacterium]